MPTDVTLMVHSSKECTDVHIIYTLLERVVRDLRDRLLVVVKYVVVSSDSHSCFIVSHYCKEHGITFNIIDATSGNFTDALSEIDPSHMILLAIPFVISIDFDTTMTTMGAFLRGGLRVIALHDYANTSLRNMSDNIMYYGF
jgi:hypothetical protein